MAERLVQGSGPQVPPLFGKNPHRNPPAMHVPNSYAGNQATLWARIKGVQAVDYCKADVIVPKYAAIIRGLRVRS